MWHRKAFTTLFLIFAFVFIAGFSFFCSSFYPRGNSNPIFCSLESDNLISSCKSDIQKQDAVLVTSINNQISPSKKSIGQSLYLYLKNSLCNSYNFVFSEVINFSEKNKKYNNKFLDVILTFQTIF